MRFQGSDGCLCWWWWCGLCFWVTKWGRYDGVMAPFLRKVTTASGASAVQIVEKIDRKNRVIEHLGSAHTDAELAVLLEVGRQKLHEGQPALDLGFAYRTATAPAVVGASSSRILTTTIRDAFTALGFDQAVDEAFFQLVLAKIVEQTSMVDSTRVLTAIGVNAVHRSTMKRALARCAGRDYRDIIAKACFTHSVATTGLSLILYDVTTLLCRHRHNKGPFVIKGVGGL